MIKGIKMGNVIQNERLLNRKEVEQVFGISVRYLEISAVRGDGPPMIKIGRSVRYSVQDMREWINGNRVRSTSDIRDI